MASNFVWYELMTSDVDAAEAFYKAVVGWKVEPFPASDMPYRIVKAGERGVGGLMTIPEDAARMGMRSNWVGYLFSANDTRRVNCSPITLSTISAVWSRRASAPRTR